MINVTQKIFNFIFSVKGALTFVAPGLALAVYWPVMFISTHLPANKIPRIEVVGKDKTLHFVACFVLTMLFWLVFYRDRRPSFRNKNLYLVIILVSCYGILDELTQKFVGRNCSFFDWIFDVSGAAAAIMTLFLLQRLSHWLTAFWCGLFIFTHFPGKPPVVLPYPWNQMGLIFYMFAYITLTFLWWRCLCPKPKFMVNRAILTYTLLFLPAYAVFDQMINLIMRRDFIVSELLVALGAIIIAIICSIAFAQQRNVDELHRYRQQETE